IFCPVCWRRNSSNTPYKIPRSEFAETLFALSLNPSALIALSFFIVRTTVSPDFPCQPCCNSFFAMESVDEFFEQTTFTGTAFLFCSQRSCPACALTQKDKPIKNVLMMIVFIRMMLYKIYLITYFNTQLPVPSTLDLLYKTSHLCSKPVQNPSVEFSPKLQKFDYMGKVFSRT